MMDLVLTNIGIIGGADGPRVFLVSGDINGWVLVTATAVTALSFALIVCRRRKK